MNAFLIELTNKPGELARVAEAIAAAGVNVTAISGSTCGEGGSVAFMTADDAATRSVLQNAVIPFREVEAIETPLPHQPGTLAKAARRLADAGVNIEAILATGMDGGNVTVAFVTGDPARARETLAQAGTTQG